MLYDEEVINQIKEWLTAHKQTIAVAESVTAGHLQAALSSAVEASKFFQGGITAYNPSSGYVAAFHPSDSFVTAYSKYGIEEDRAEPGLLV